MEQFEVLVGKTRDFDIKGIGSVMFKKWFSGKAEIELADATIYLLEPRGLWKGGYNLLKDGQILFEVKMSFWGKITITPVKEQHHFYTIKGMGFKKFGYKIIDYKEEELAGITSNFTWKSFKETYTLQVKPGLTDTETGKLLVLLLGYQFRAMQRAAAAAVVAS